MSATIPNLTGFDAGLPANIDAEKTILGAVLLDNAAWDEVERGMRSDDFSLDSHQRIAKRMRQLIKRNSTVDIVTLAEELAKHKEVESVGGVAYLASLTEGLPRRPVIDAYIRIVKDKSLLRQQMRICSESIARCADQAQTALEIIGQTEAEMNTLAQSFRHEKTLEEMAFSAMDNLLRAHKGEVKRYVASGCDMIDRTTGGYAKGELTMIAARPKIGKSALLRQGIYANCNRGNFCHYVSPEMTDEKIILLLAAREAKIPWKYVNHPETLNQLQIQFLTGAISTVSEWPLRLDCRTPISAGEAVALGRATKREKNTFLLGIDYFQKLHWGNERESRWMQQSDAWGDFSNLAKSEDMAVVVLSSLTEGKAKDMDAPPTENELRGSGDAKFEVSTLYILHRKRDNETRKLESKTQLITSLARFDEDGAKPMTFHKDSLHFEGVWDDAPYYTED
jgi:replicative DNA helicase